MTFREKSTNKLYAFALAAVFAIALAGCGGGGGGTAAAPDPDPTPMPSEQEQCEGAGGRYNADGSCTSADDLAEEMALSGAQEAAMAAYMAAMAAVGGAKDPVAAGNAQMYAAMAKEASDAAAMATTSEMAMEYQMKAEMNRDMAMEAAMMRGLGLTSKANMITNQAAIDNAILEGTEPDDPVSNAVRVGTVLETVADTAPVITTGDVSQGTAVSADATYGASGPSFTVTGVATAWGRGEAPALLTTRGGWMGRELLETGNTDSYAIVFTDIQMDTPGTPIAGTEVLTNDALNALVTTTPANNPIITGDPGDGSTFSGTLNRDPDDNTPPEPGVFTCPANIACAILTNDDGGVVNVAGYTFNEASTATNAPTSDTDYLAWGVWLSVPDDATTAATAGAFASGNMVFTVNAELKGTASYNGVANGMYAAGGMVEYFDADASLTANFGGNVAGGDDNTLLGAVTGSITNIKAGGMDVEGSVTLGRATITTSGPAAGFAGETSGSLAGRAVSGDWGGQFYGPSSTSETQYPTTAAGTFGAVAPGVGADRIRILGSFGVWKAE